MCLRASFGAFGTKRRESMYQNVSYMLLQHQNQYGSNSWKIYQHIFFIFLLFLKNCPSIGIKRDFLIFNQNVHDILSNVISLENERSDFFFTREPRLFGLILRKNSAKRSKRKKNNNRNLYHHLHIFSFVCPVCVNVYTQRHRHMYVYLDVEYIYTNAHQHFIGAHYVWLSTM